jgi:hypothetical protein
MKPREFFDLVAIMRDKQKEYFNTRSADTLRDCKAIEKQVDDEIFRATRIVQLHETAQRVVDYVNNAPSKTQQQ